MDYEKELETVNRKLASLTIIRDELNKKIEALNKEQGILKSHVSNQTFTSDIFIEILRKEILANPTKESVQDLKKCVYSYLTGTTSKLELDPSVLTNEEQAWLNAFERSRNDCVKGLIKFVYGVPNEVKKYTMEADEKHWTRNIGFIDDLRRSYNPKLFSTHFKDGNLFPEGSNVFQRYYEMKFEGHNAGDIDEWLTDVVVDEIYRYIQKGETIPEFSEEVRVVDDHFLTYLQQENKFDGMSI